MVKCVMCGNEIIDAKSKKRKYCLDCMPIYRKNLMRSYYVRNKDKYKEWNKKISEKRKRGEYKKKKKVKTIPVDYKNGLKINYTQAEFVRLYLLKIRKGLIFV